MRTVGQILQEARLEKGFSLEQVEKAIKIRIKFLKSLETDDYKNLPPVPYVQGFIKNYSEFLGIKHYTLLALFRRQFLDQARQKKTIIEEPLTETRWKLTPNRVIAVFTMIMFAVLLVYFYIQYQALHTPPPLTVASPKQDLVTKDDVLAVFGDTDPDATIFINKDPILVKENGKFFKEISLNFGSNTVVIEAVNRTGAKTSVSRFVTRAP